MSNSVMQKQLNAVVNSGQNCYIKNVSGNDRLFRYQPFLDAVLHAIVMASKTSEIAEMEFQEWLDSGNCYVFEVGLHNGDVFSASMVDRITITNDYAIICLKGSNEE